jgi:hypothetical protein
MRIGYEKANLYNQSLVSPFINRLLKKISLSGEGGVL